MKLEEAIKQWPSIEARNLDAQIMRDVFEVGVTSQGAISIPIHSPTGLRIGQLVRTLSGEPKYRHEPPEATGYLYNYHRRPKEPQDCVLIQESPFDVFSLYPIFSVALVGVNLDDLKLRCLRKMKARCNILALDKDAAGRDAMFRMAFTLIELGLTTIIYQHGLQIKEDYEHVCEIGLKMRSGTFMIV